MNNNIIKKAVLAIILLTSACGASLQQRSLETVARSQEVAQCGDAKLTYLGGGLVNASACGGKRTYAVNCYASGCFSEWVLAPMLPEWGPVGGAR